MGVLRSSRTQLVALKNPYGILISDILSSVLQLRVVPAQCISPEKLAKMESFEKADIVLLDNLSEFKDEVANSPKFAGELSLGVDIFVNDSFSQSHKILGSTVGVTRFCDACVAGFHFEESLNQLRNVKETKREPYMAIVCIFRLLAIKLISFSRVFPCFFVQFCCLGNFFFVFH